MTLYPGTTEPGARKALREGLRTRAETGSTGNWQHTVSSPTDRVYLTEAYAPYFAHAAQPDDVPLPEQRWAIIEVDVGVLAESDLMPDEDWLEQGSRGDIPEDHVLRDLGYDKCRGMKERTEFMREHAPYFASAWRASVKGIGGCCHAGSIGAEAITRVSIYRPATNPAITFSAFDPTISLANYGFCADKFRGLTRWFFEAVPVPVFLNGGPLIDGTDDRSGITIIEGAGA